MASLTALLSLMSQSDRWMWEVLYNVKEINGFVKESGGVETETYFPDLVFSKCCLLLRHISFDSFDSRNCFCLRNIVCKDKKGFRNC